MLELSLITEQSLPIELAGLTPDWARDKSLTEIARLPILHGNQRREMGELFKISGDPADEVWKLHGNLSAVHRLGVGMRSGRIEVHGPIGRHLGAEMTGGEIVASEDVGDFAGCQMRGGKIRIAGDAGDYLGGAYAGSSRGMRGGTITVRSNAGREVATCMRRGLIAVAGSMGPFAAQEMRAGTLVVLGQAAGPIAPGMRRGTVLLGANPESVLPTYLSGGSVRPVVVRMLLLSLQRDGFPIPAKLLEGGYDLYHGDAVTLCRGELLIARN
ncbi:MAG: formylmethanofuran dehydrogenase subunit C [Planctomycetota bacterium]|nr:formylmethanofuran dehydrogenase subunit C [Planctomycetota bacterium]